MVATRPRWHFTARSGWINDPHGLTFHEGRYHLFHQYVPGTTAWAPSCHWGHATSTDLLSWEHREVSLAPGDGDDGVWTGALVVDDGDPWIFYTSVSEPDLALGRVRTARAADDAWDTWTKGDVVVRPPDDLDLVAFRDPAVVRDGAGWRMFVGGAARSGEALVLTYTSEDLASWRYDGIALSRSTVETEPVWTGSLWECPQVFDVDDHTVMLTSVWDADVLHHAAYALGGPESFAAGRLRPTSWGRLSFGASYYAPTFFRDRDGRPCVLFWMRGVVDPDGEWAGCLSVPHLLSVHEGRLVAEPHPAVRDTRGAALAPGELAESLDVEWAPEASGDRLVLTGDDRETARLVVTDDAVRLERPDAAPWSMPWDGEPLRVIVDGPVLEVVSSRGLLGGPVGAVSTFRVAGGVVRAWALGP